MVAKLGKIMSLLRNADQFSLKAIKFLSFKNEFSLHVLLVKQNFHLGMLKSYIIIEKSRQALNI